MKEKEIWKPVKDYEGFYEVSNMGRVKSLTRRIKRSRGGTQIMRGRILTPGFGKKNKYRSVHLSKYGVQKSKTVHIIVAEHFLGERPEGMVIDHINNNPSDNRASNLRYCTQRENLCTRSEVSKAGYVGVHINPPNYKNRYRARIRINGKMKELGSYFTAEEAGQAYINYKNKLEK